jgi:hypothetical protein
LKIYQKQFGQNLLGTEGAFAVFFIGAIAISAGGRFGSGGTGGGPDCFISMPWTGLSVAEPVFFKPDTPPNTGAVLTQRRKKERKKEINRTLTTD